MNSKPKLLLGWKEWVSLPDLGISGIKAKVDTGARTSALHTFELMSFEKNGAEWVRFKIHPYQLNEDHVLECEALVHDKRIVSDSGGHKEERYVIVTQLYIGDLLKDVELTLTNRDTMRFRMLLGRTAMNGFMIVDPEKSYLTGRKFYKKIR